MQSEEKKKIAWTLIFRIIERRKTNHWIRDLYCPLLSTLKSRGRGLDHDSSYGKFMTDRGLEGVIYAWCD